MSCEILAGTSGVLPAITPPLFMATFHVCLVAECAIPAAIPVLYLCVK